MGFLDRGRRAGPWLEWKVRLFAVAAVLALAGMYKQQGWMTGAAIVFLIVAMLLRFLPGGGPEPVDMDETEGGDVDDDTGTRERGRTT